MSASGLDPVGIHLDGTPALAGRRSDFRLRWAAVKLYTSVVVAEFPTQVGADELDIFLGAATRWAIENGANARSPWSIRPQSGVAVIAAAVVPTLVPAPREWAVAHGSRFAVVTYPVVVDLAGGMVIQPKRVVVGRVFAPFLRELVASVLQAPLAPGGGAH
jgi:hypothetical protein